MHLKTRQRTTKFLLTPFKLSLFKLSHNFTTPVQRPSSKLKIQLQTKQSLKHIQSNPQAPNGKSKQIRFIHRNIISSAPAQYSAKNIKTEFKEQQTENRIYFTLGPNADPI